MNLKIIFLLAVNSSILTEKLHGLLTDALANCEPVNTPAKTIHNKSLNFNILEAFFEIAENWYFYFYLSNVSRKFPLIHELIYKIDRP